MMNTNTTPEKELTGYPSIDKPWLKYYDEKTRTTQRARLIFRRGGGKPVNPRHRKQGEIL